MAVTLTMLEAFEQAEEEIWNFHNTVGFPAALTHHVSREIPREMSLAPGLHDYDDMGNWSGSLLMYFMMFKCGGDVDDSILRIFDQTGCRADVYRHCGPEIQRSGKGQDNDRTNLLEAILAHMGPEHGRRLQRAWKWVRIYANRHPGLTRENLLAMATTDPSTDIYTDVDEIVDYILDKFGMGSDVDTCDAFKRIVPFLLSARAPPSYSEICNMTGCSRKNSKKKKLYWSASSKFLEMLHPPSV